MQPRDARETSAAGETMYASILAGGSGTRLWPLSAKRFPKQFLPLPGPRSMFQETIVRLEPLVPLDNLYVVTFDAYENLVAQQAPALDPTHIVAEPAGRGTAASIGLAATLIAARDPHAVMGSFHADHVIADVEGFRAAVRLAQTVAREGYLVTLGISPTYPETGYGYIRYGEPLGAPDGAGDLAHMRGLGAHRVEQFVEKPKRAVAEAYLRAGNYVWNSGIFVWRVDRILEEIRRHVPVVSDVLDEIGAAARASQGRVTPEVDAVIRSVWPRLQENITIDVGVMERASDIAVIPMAVGWNDIGSWSQVATLYPANPAGNVVIGLHEGTLGGDSAAIPAPGGSDFLATQTRDTLIYSTTGRRIATAGVEGLVIVDTPEGLLICSKEQAQLVKDLAEYAQAHPLASTRQQSQQPERRAEDNPASASSTSSK
ncbi:MAG TPA: mannose-1-phosphate guanylyltransferase [Ktedonobacterales bacterium]